MARLSVAAKRWIAAGTALGAATPMATASAQEYCVDCKSPDAIYRCVIDNSGRPGVPLKMQCMTALAQSGKHASCSIKGGTVFDCDGPIFRLDARLPVTPPISPAAPPPEKSGATNPTGPPAETKRSEPAAPPSASPKREPQPTKTDGTPRTVEALAKEMTKSSSETLDKAGGAIANGARQTWDCIASFFKSC